MVPAQAVVHPSVEWDGHLPDTRGLPPHHSSANQTDPTHRSKPPTGPQPTRFPDTSHMPRVASTPTEPLSPRGSL